MIFAWRQPNVGARRATVSVRYREVGKERDLLGLDWRSLGDTTNAHKNPNKTGTNRPICYMNATTRNYDRSTAQSSSAAGPLTGTLRAPVHGDLGFRLEAGTSDASMLLFSPTYLRRVPQSFSTSWPPVQSPCTDQQTSLRRPHGHLDFMVVSTF
jgi:hypothetical protein